MMGLRSFGGGRSTAHARRPLRVFEISILVGEYQVPAEMPEMAPGLQNHTTLKRLAFRCDHQTVIFAPCAGVRFTPVKFECFEFQCIERKKQVFRPLVAVAAFPEAVIHEEIIEDRRAKHVILAPEPASSGVGALRYGLRFFWIDFR